MFRRPLGVTPCCRASDTAEDNVVVWGKSRGCAQVVCAWPVLLSKAERRQPGYMTREGLETCREALDPGEAEDNQTPLVRPAAWHQLLGLHWFRRRRIARCRIRPKVGLLAGAGGCCAAASLNEN